MGRATRARGISLLEVLIAMFVMLFGLMGVAAIMPVGNHYAGKSDQYDRGAALAASAFAEVKARGMLGPGIWIYPDNSSVIDGNGFFAGPPANLGQAFVIDPVGAAETLPGDGACNLFPYDAPNPGWTTVPASTLWPIRRVTFSPYLGGPKLIPLVAQSIFQLRDDLAMQLPTENDHPGIQRWATADVDFNGNANNTPDDPTDDLPLARAYVGNYSWLATVVPTTANGDATPDALQGMQPGDARHGSFLYDVSVAVFYKRESLPSLESERQLEAELGPGGGLVLYGPDDATIDAATDNIRPGQWIALAGVHPTTGKLLLRWYRLLSLDDENGDVVTAQYGNSLGRNAMVEGPDWPTANNLQVAQSLRAILLPGIVGVTTQTVKLSTE